MEKPFVFDYQTFAELLVAWTDWLKETNAKFSIRWAAKRMGLKSHAHLLRLVSGEKYPSDELLNRLAALMDLTVDEFAFVRALAELSRTKRPDERAFILDKIESLKRTVPDALLQLDAFELIAHWYHLAIFEMTVLPDFQSDPEWIATRLGGSVSTEMVVDSLTRLEKLGLICRSRDKFVRAVDQFNTTHNIPSVAIRTFHAEMLEKARLALNEVPVNLRCFFGHTMPFDTQKLEQASNLLIEFRGRFHKLMEGGEPDSIYHLGLQFVPLTKITDSHF